MIDIFSESVFDMAEQRAGYILSKKDEKKRRSSLKKTDKQIFDDFLHNVTHPFATVLKKDAAEHAATGKPFVLHSRISILTDNREGNAFSLYHNEGDTWRQSGNALFSKYLQELYPELEMPKLKLGVKGLKFLLEAYPDKFTAIREKLKERAQEGDDEDEENDLPFDEEPTAEELEQCELEDQWNDTIPTGGNTNV